MPKFRLHNGRVLYRCDPCYVGGQRDRDRLAVSFIAALRARGIVSRRSAATVDRLEQGSVQHARRRAEEMAAAGDLLDDLGVPPRIARASQAWLEQLMNEQPASPGPET